MEEGKDYGIIGVFGKPVTRVFVAASQRPNFLSTSTRSKRLRTLRFFPPLLALPKLACLVMALSFVDYLIFGIYANSATSPERALGLSL